MNFIRLIPVIISLLLLSAHFSRLGITIFSLLFLLTPFLLFINKQWITTLIKVFLIFGTIEWLRSLLYYVHQRQLAGEPYVRLIIIIGGVAVFTGLSIFVFRNTNIKNYFNLK